MKSQLFTNILLTLILCMLGVIALQNAGIINTPRKDVQIVSIVQPKKITSDSKWDDISISGEVQIRHEGFGKGF